MFSIAAFLALPLACTALEEQRVAPDQVDWSGMVLANVTDEEEPLELSEGSVVMVDLEDQLLAEATQPYENSPGWWSFEDLPIGEEVAIRISGDDASDTLPELVPMVWRGTVPEGQAFWLQNALFTMDRQSVEDSLASLAEIGGILAGDLSEEAVAHLWGQPWDPEAWEDATIKITNALGEDVSVLKLAYDEEGNLVEAGDGPIDLFFGLNLVPGTTTLEVRDTTGEMITTTWPTRGGDLLSGFFHALPGADS